MTLKILQWNINGYSSNYHELQLLIKEKSPDIICIQETHIPLTPISNPFYPKQYLGYFFNLNNIQTNKQGVGILIKRHIPHEVINITSSLSTIALKLNLNLPFGIASTYIHPQQVFSETDLRNLFQQLPTPILWTGDFNAWNHLWGSQKSNARGSIIENFILNHHLVLLNNGSPTHFSTHSTLTHFDLSLASPQLSPRIKWNISTDLKGSDYFPISITVQTSLHPIKYNHRPIFKTDFAKWDAF
uniref:Putative RNA-directed DNA polymerase from transposon X-element n=1 Tax=Bactrocera latifrons TaxID=174628 RepID=A0A0K8W561_BACLA